MNTTPARLPLRIAAFALAQALGWGMTFNLPAITGQAMADDLGMSYVAAMAGPTVMLTLMALAAVPLLRAFEQLGARVVMTAGTGFAALGLAVIALAPHAWAYYFGWVIIGAAGAAMLTTAMQIALAELAGPGARKAIGALMVFGGLGTTLCWPLLGALQSAFGWRTATMAGAAILLVVAAPIYWFLLARRPASAPKPRADNAAAALDWPAFSLLAFSIAINGIVTWGFSLTIITLFEGKGLSHEQAVLIASMIGIMALLARLVDFAGGARWSSLLTGFIAAAGLPASFAVLILGAGAPAAIVFVGLYGLTSGALAVARSTMPLELFPVAAYARASSMLALPLNLAFACAPPLFAWIIAGPGSDAALWVAMALSLAALSALGLLLVRQRRLVAAH